MTKEAYKNVLPLFLVLTKTATSTSQSHSLPISTQAGRVSVRQAAPVLLSLKPLLWVFQDSHQGVELLLCFLENFTNSQFLLSKLFPFFWVSSHSQTCTCLLHSKNKSTIKLPLDIIALLIYASTCSFPWQLNCLKERIFAVSVYSPAHSLFNLLLSGCTLTTLLKIHFQR